jgi:pimeloyl-ACP methyl ester carboxylesterase
MAARAVELTADDGAVLRGIAWERGPCWLVLMHERGWDLDRFRPLVPVLGANGLSALALDRRGHGGSDGRAGGSCEEDDVRAAVGWARAAGAECVIVVAAGDAALIALAAVEVQAPDGCVLLSPPLPEPELLPRLRGGGVPRLVLTGQLDPAADAAATALRRVAVGWLLVVGLPTAQQGTDLLAGDLGAHAHEHLVRFAAETSWLAAGAAR